MGSRVNLDRWWRNGRPAALAVPAVAVTLGLWLVTRLGPFLAPDSVFYLGVARSLSSGDGYLAPPGTQPIGNFPPVFPLVMAGLGALGVDPMTVVGWLNPALVGLLVLGVALVVYRRFGSVLLGSGAGLAVAVNIDLLVYGSSALSEPLFSILALAGLWAVAHHLEAPNRSAAWLVVGGTLMAASVLTRYVGVAACVTGAVTLARAGRRRPAAVFMVVTLLPIALWIAWAGGTNRPFVVHGLARRDLLIAGRTVSRWFLPVTEQWLLRVRIGLFLLTVLAAGWFWLWRRGAARVSGPPLVLESVLATFAAVYMVALLTSRLFFDFSSRFDGRALVPLVPVLMVLTASLLARIRGVCRMPVNLLVAGIGTFLVGLQLIQAVGWVDDGITDASVERRGYSAAAWQRSRVVDLVEGLSPSTPVYSNGADVLYLLTGRRTRVLPANVDYLTGRPNALFGPEMRAMESNLRQRDGVVVYFSAVRARRRILPAEADLSGLLDLRPVTADEVGTLYRLAAVSGFDGQGTRGG